MTVGELANLCFQKIAQERPLRLLCLSPSAREDGKIQIAMREMLIEYWFEDDTDELMEAVAALYESLQKELDLCDLSDGADLLLDTPLPPATNALAEKFRDEHSEAPASLSYVVRLESGEQYHPISGPIRCCNLAFASLAPATQWLTERGFSEVGRNIWWRHSPAVIEYPSGQSIKVDSLRALVESFYAPECCKLTSPTS